MQITWQWTAWAGVVTGIIIIAIAIYSLREKERGISNRLILGALFGLPLLATAWLSWQIFRHNIIAWQSWTAIGICALAAIFWGYGAVIGLTEKHRLTIGLIPLAISLIATSGTGIYNQITASQSPAAQVASKIAYLQNAHLQLQASQKAMEEALQAMELAQVEATRLEETISELEAEQQELSQWLEVKGNEALLRKYLEEQFQHSSREQAIWAIVGILAGTLLGLVMPSVIERFKE